MIRARPSGGMFTISVFAPLPGGGADPLISRIWKVTSCRWRMCRCPELLVKDQISVAPKATDTSTRFGSKAFPLMTQTPLDWLSVNERVTEASDWGMGVKDANVGGVAPVTGVAGST